MPGFLPQLSPNHPGPRLSATTIFSFAGNLPGFSGFSRVLPGPIKPSRRALRVFGGTFRVNSGSLSVFPPGLSGSIYFAQRTQPPVCRETGTAGPPKIFAEFWGYDSFCHIPHAKMPHVKIKNLHSYAIRRVEAPRNARQCPSTTRPVGCLPRETPCLIRRVALPSGSAKHHQLSLRNNQNQPKPTDNEFLNSVGFGRFKLVLVGFGYQVAEKAEKRPSFHLDFRLLFQPEPTKPHPLTQRTEREAQNFSAENFSENHLRTAKETRKFDRKTVKNALRLNPKPISHSGNSVCSCSSRACNFGAKTVQLWCNTSAKATKADKHTIFSTCWLLSLYEHQGQCCGILPTLSPAAFPRISHSLMYFLVTSTLVFAALRASYSL